MDPMRHIIILAIAGLGLAACGDTTGERAATGGLIGGAAGLAVGMPIAGAAVGAGTGAVTDEDDF
jgi:uncharacterized membrane protein